MTTASNPGKGDIDAAVVTSVSDALYHRLMQTGDVWRTRAATAAGFLATAAATLVAGIILRGANHIGTGTRVAGVVAIVTFVAGASSFSAAALHTPPRPPDPAESGGEFVTKALEFVQEDRKGVWRWLKAGQWAGTVALGAAILTVVLTVIEQPRASEGTVVLSGDGTTAARSLCTQLGSTLNGAIRRDDGRVNIRLDQPCKDIRRISVRDDDVILITRER